MKTNTKRAFLTQLWLDALESGQYHQTKGSLSNNYGSSRQSFCCLGVLCVVAKNSGLNIKDDVIENNDVLPKSISRIMGLDALGTFKTPVHYRGHSYDHLADLNDKGVRFKTIARIIREQLAAKNFERE